MERLEALLDERERESLSEHVDLERLRRRCVDAPPGDRAAVGRDEELADRVPPNVGRSIVERRVLVPRIRCRVEAQASGRREKHRRWRAVQFHASEAGVGVQRKRERRVADDDDAVYAVAVSKSVHAEMRPHSTSGT